MKVKCAWCDCDLGEQMGPDELTSHGICDNCAADVRKHTSICELHGRYFPVHSWLDGKPTCPKCDVELREGYGEKVSTLDEVNARRGHGEE